MPDLTERIRLELKAVVLAYAAELERVDATALVGPASVAARLRRIVEGEQ